MKACFVPADLRLDENPDGFHVVVLQGREIFRARSEKAAVAEFNRLRLDLEAKYPATELTPEQKAEIFRNATIESMVAHNSLGGRKKKTSAGGTRTFSR